MASQVFSLVTDPIINDLVDEELLDAYSECAARLGTLDLVLWLDLTTDELSAHRRTDFEADFSSFVRTADEPYFHRLLQDLSGPASARAATLRGPSGFWLLVFSADGSLMHFPIACQRLPDTPGLS